MTAILSHNLETYIFRASQVEMSEPLPRLPSCMDTRWELGLGSSTIVWRIDPPGGADGGEGRKALYWHGKS